MSENKKTLNKELQFEERLVKEEVLQAIHCHFIPTRTKFFPAYKQALRGERFAFLIVFAFDRARGKTLHT